MVDTAEVLQQLDLDSNPGVPNFFCRVLYRLGSSHQRANQADRLRYNLLLGESFTASWTAGLSVWDISWALVAYLPEGVFVVSSCFTVHSKDWCCSVWISTGLHILPSYDQRGATLHNSVPLF